MGLMDTLNQKLENSAVGRYFEVKERKTNLGTEIRGGTVTFLTVCYILAVNANIVADTGGPCIEDGVCLVGVPPAFQTDECQQCVMTVKKSLISATAAACIISHFLMGILGNLPLAVCPGMGLNAYFTYTVVGFMGKGMVTYSMALAAVFIEGFIFIAISVVGIRGKLVQYIPQSVMLATSAGIGLFLAHIGFQASEGLGVVTYNGATLVTLGGCPPANRIHQYTISEADVNSGNICSVTNGVAEANGALFVPSGTYQCGSAGVMRSGTMWLGIWGGLLMVILMAKGVRGSMIVGILFVTFISWIPTDRNSAKYLEKPGDTPQADWTPAMYRWDDFTNVASVPSTAATAGRLDFSGFKTGQLWLALITFLYVDFIDCTGTLYSMANYISNFIPGFINQKTKQIPRQLPTFCVDGFSIIVGALLGVPPLTIYVESASGIREGARTGIAALVISFYFFIALWFSPLLAAIPPYATGPALVLVGAMMVINIVKIRWDVVSEAVPAFLTMALMPLTYSISYGVIAGIMSYIIINGAIFLWNLVQLKLFPNSVSEDSLKGGNTYRIVKKMTFHLRGDGSDDEDVGDLHHIPGEPMKPAKDVEDVEDSVGKGAKAISSAGASTVGV